MRLATAGPRLASVLAIALALAFLLTACFGACAQAAPAGQEAVRAVAQTASKEPPAGALGDRVTALEKENLVLREDLGRARLEARSQLEAAAKRQAEAISRLQKQLDEESARLQAERERNEKRNRNLWYAVGALALGILLAD